MQPIIPNNRFGEEVEEYLGLKGKATRFVYSSAFGHFLNFYGNKYGEEKGFSDYLDRIFEELKKSRREQKRVAEIELVDFINYLKDLGMSNNTIRLYFAAVQNFLKYKQIIVSSLFIGNLPPPVEKPINHKHEWTIEEIKSFVDSAPTFRDKAIIVCLFQSGLGVNELTQLNYEHIQDEFEKGTIPVCLRLTRARALVNKVSDELIQFFMGHSIGSTKDAYLNMPTEELRDLYMDSVEKHLVLEKSSRDGSTSTISPELQQKIKNLESKIEWWQRFMEERLKQALPYIQKLGKDNIPITTGAIADCLGISQSYAYGILNGLKNRGYLIVEKKGRENHYRPSLNFANALKSGIKRLDYLKLKKDAETFENRQFEAWIRKKITNIAYHPVTGEEVKLWD